MDVLKPYFVLACVAFMAGFLGYWVLGQAFTAAAPGAAPVYQAPASAPLATPDLHRGKLI